MPSKSYKQDSSTPKSTLSKSLQRTSVSPTKLLQRAQAGPDHLAPHEVLHLQRTIGNRALTQLLNSQAPTSSEAPIQRTVETAGAAIHADSRAHINFDKLLTANFLAGHGLVVTPTASLLQLQAAVRAEVRRLRIQDAAKALRALMKKEFPANQFKPNAFKLLATDLADVKLAYDAIVASEETPTQRAVRVFLNETLPGNRTNVTLNAHGVIVALDSDQLKHQKKAYPIGSREVGGGQKFKLDNANPGCGSEAWHLANTLPHMATWAHGKGVMVEGQKIEHGQLQEVAGIHYEGYCFFANGQKYVLFHCYPHPGGIYDGGKKA